LVLLKPNNRIDGRINAVGVTDDDKSVNNCRARIGLFFVVNFARRPYMKYRERTNNEIQHDRDTPSTVVFFFKRRYCTGIEYAPTERYLDRMS